MNSIIWYNYVIIICVIIALHAMQLLHERDNERKIFASRCRIFKSKSTEADANFISQYLLHLTSIQRNFCIVEMRQTSFTIWCNYIIIICWNIWCAAIASSHCIQKNQLEISEMTIRQSNRLFLWKSKFAIDSIKFESFIAIYRFLFIRSEFYRFLDWFFDKNWYFVKRTSIKFITWFCFW